MVRAEGTGQKEAIGLERIVTKDRDDYPADNECGNNSDQRREYLAKYVHTLAACKKNAPDREHSRLS